MITLVLNMNYEFLGFTDYKGAVCAAYTDRATVMEEYDKVVRSPSFSMKIPAVIRLKRYVRVRYDKITYVSFTKRNVHLRDNHVCQYCSETLSKKDACIDHVIPVSRNGKNTWDNTVSSCKSCNADKDDRTPSEAGLRLLRKPGRPRGFTEIIRIKIGEIHDLWVKYLR